MGIIGIIGKRFKQTTVYWEKTGNDGQGGSLFANPEERVCRWEQIGQLVTGNEGNVMNCRAVIYLKEDVAEEGMLFLGTLDDLTQEQENNPTTVPTAYVIKRFEKDPVLGSCTQFLRKAYLTPSLSFGGF
jgi:hypothetical protein